MTRPEEFEFDVYQGLPRDVQFKINEAIKDLYIKTESSLLILSDRAGRLVSVEGGLKELDASVLSAVSASFFAALAEIGNLIGESRRSAYQYYEGDTFKIYLTFVNDDFFLTAVFKGLVPLGLVRTFCNQSLKVLRSWLIAADVEKRDEDRKAAANVLDSDFARKLDETLDQILGGAGDE